MHARLQQPEKLASTACASALPRDSLRWRARGICLRDHQRTDDDPIRHRRDGFASHSQRSDGRRASIHRDRHRSGQWRDRRHLERQRNLGRQFDPPHDRRDRRDDRALYGAQRASVPGHGDRDRNEHDRPIEIRQRRRHRHVRGDEFDFAVIRECRPRSNATIHRVVLPRRWREHRLGRERNCGRQFDPWHDRRNWPEHRALHSPCRSSLRQPCHHSRDGELRRRESADRVRDRHSHERRQRQYLASRRNALPRPARFVHTNRCQHS